MKHGLYGNLELLLLKTLMDLDKPIHGLDLAREIERRSDDYLQIEEGAIYPALLRLRKQGMVEAEWRISDKKRRARFYEITDAGRSHLTHELESWHEQINAFNRVLDFKEES